MATQPHSFITAEQFYQLPQEEGREFELLDGEIIEMASATPLHNVAVRKVLLALYPYLDGRGGAIPETDFSDGRTTILRPDLAILLGEKYTSLDLEKLPVTIAPDIVIEVISPSESWMRVEHRINRLLDFGVEEIWTVNLEEREIKIHRRSGTRPLRADDTLESSKLPGWSIPVARVFER